MLGLALDDNPLILVVPPLARRTPSGGAGTGNPYVPRLIAGGVGSGGAPDIPGSIVYARDCGELGKGVCNALMVAED